MTFHMQHDENISDDHFLEGTLAFMCVGNQCRLMDGRRTPGYIESINEFSGEFQWKITAFEDEGKSWNVPFESIQNYQFHKESKTLECTVIDRYQQKIDELNHSIKIDASNSDFEEELMSMEKNAKQWLLSKSVFFKKQKTLNFDLPECDEDLASDLELYLTEWGGIEIEKQFSALFSVNPYDEYVKMITIVLAELGIVPYSGKVLRDPTKYTEKQREDIKRYVCNRLAFVRAYYRLLNRESVVLYRGMCTEGEWMNSYQKSLTSWTFDVKAALAFCDLDRENTYKHGYVLKRTLSVDQIFLSYFETKALASQYKESEAILFFNQEKGIW